MYEILQQNKLVIFINIFILYLLKYITYTTLNLIYRYFFALFLLVSCTLLVWNCFGIRRKTERLRAVDFSIMKNPTTSVGSEPAILGSTQTPRPPKPLFLKLHELFGMYVLSVQLI
jgi:hypothetical protein